MRDLSDLDKVSFERLVNDLLYAELAGKGAFIPNPTLFGVKDGGIDAEFDGEFRKTTGRWIVSVKGCSSAATLTKDLDDDFQRYTDRAWLVVTSFEPRTAPNGRNPLSEADQLDHWLSEHSKVRRPSHLVTGLEVKLWLRRHPFIARSYGLVEGAGDLYFRAAGEVAGQQERVPPPTRPRDLLDRVAQALGSEQSRIVIVQGPLGLGQPDLAAALVREVFLCRGRWSDTRRPVAVLVDETWLSSPQELNRALRSELDLSSNTYLFVVPPGPRAGELARGLWARVQDRDHRVLAFLTEAQVQDQGFAHAPPRAQLIAIEPLPVNLVEDEPIRRTDEQFVRLLREASGRVEFAVDLATGRLLDRGMWILDHLGPLLADLDLSLEAARDALCVVTALAPVGVAEGDTDVAALDGIAEIVGCPVVALERLCGRLELWGLLQRRAWSANFVWELDAPLLSRAIQVALWRGPRRARLTERLLRHEGAAKAARALMKWDDELALRLVEGLTGPVRWGGLAALGQPLARLRLLTGLTPRVADAVVRLVCVGGERLSQVLREERAGQGEDGVQDLLRVLADLLVLASGHSADARQATQALFDLLALDAAAGDSLLADLGKRWAQPPDLAPLATETLGGLRTRITEVPLPPWLTPLAVAVAKPWLESAHRLQYICSPGGIAGAAVQDARTAAVDLLIAMTSHSEQEAWNTAWTALVEWTAFAPAPPLPPAIQMSVHAVLLHAERELSAELDWARRAAIERTVRLLAWRTGAHEGAAACALRRFSTDPSYLAWRWLLGDRDVVQDAARLAERLDVGEGEAAVRDHLPMYPAENGRYEAELAGRLAALLPEIDDALHLLERVAESVPRELPRVGSGLLAAWMGHAPTLWRRLLWGDGWVRIPRVSRGILLRSAFFAETFGHPRPFSGDDLAQVTAVALDELERLRLHPTEATEDDLRDLFVPLWPLLDLDRRTALFLALSEHPDPRAREIVAAEVESWQCGYFPKPTRQDVAEVITRLTNGHPGAAATRALLDKLSYNGDDPESLVPRALGLALLNHPDTLRHRCWNVAYPEHPHAEARVMSAVMRAEPELWLQRVRQLSADRAAWFVAPVDPVVAGDLLRRWSVGYPIEERDREALYRLVEQTDPDETARLVKELGAEGRWAVAAEVLVLVAPSATDTYADAVTAVIGTLAAAERDRVAAGIRSRLCWAWSGEAPVANWGAVARCLDVQGQRKTGEVGAALRRLAQDIVRMCTLYASWGR